MATNARSSLKYIPNLSGIKPSFDYLDLSGNYAQTVDFLVFCQGQNITPYVSELSWTYSTDMPSADISLQNGTNCLTITPDNVRGIWQNTIPFEDWLAKRPKFTPAGINGAPITSYLNSEQVKRNLYEFKKQGQSDMATDASGRSPYFSKWILSPPQCIFHRMDPVRIFYRVPWATADAKNCWIPAFTGYIETVNTSLNSATGEGTIDMTLTTIKSVLKKTRIAMNPFVLRTGSLADELITSDEDVDRLFSDVLIPSNNYTNILYQKPPDELISYLLLGKYNEELAGTDFTNVKQTAASQIDRGRATATYVAPVASDALARVPLADRVKMSPNDPRMDSYAAFTEAKYGLPPGILVGIKNVGEESHTNYARSHRGAVGLMQFMPATAKSYGLKVADSLDPTKDERLDPAKSIDAAGKYIKDNLKRSKGNIPIALADYNGGPPQADILRKIKSTSGVLDRDIIANSPLTKETKNYVLRMDSYLNTNAQNQQNTLQNLINNPLDAAVAQAQQVGVGVDETATQTGNQLFDSSIVTDRQKKQEVSAKFRGVGNLTTFFKYIPTGNSNFESWNRGCIYGFDSANKSGFRNDPLTLAEVFDIGYQCYAGSVSLEAGDKGKQRDGVYCPHGSGATVAMLIPADGFGFQTLEPFKFRDTVGTYQADFQSRLDLIDSVISPIDYKFSISGNGDLIFEFPLYDSQPSNYGDFQQAYCFANLMDSETFSENATEMPTHIVITGGSPAQQIDASTLDDSVTRFFRIDVILPALASRLGIETVNVPFPYTFNPKQLAFFGLNYLQQRLTELYTYSVSGTDRKSVV